MADETGAGAGAPGTRPAGVPLGWAGSRAFLLRGPGPGEGRRVESRPRDGAQGLGALGRPGTSRAAGCPATCEAPATARSAAAARPARRRAVGPGATTGASTATSSTGATTRCATSTSGSTG